MPRIVKVKSNPKLHRSKSVAQVRVGCQCIKEGFNFIYYYYYYLSVSVNLEGPALYIWDLTWLS